MNNMAQALTTIGIGLVVFVAGQIFLKLVLDPLAELRRTLADAKFFPKLWANRYMTRESADRDKLGEGNWQEMRLAQSDLRSASVKIARDIAVVWPKRLLSFYAFLRLIPGLADLKTVQQNLMHLSNLVFQADFDAIGKAGAEIDRILE